MDNNGSNKANPCSSAVVCDNMPTWMKHHVVELTKVWIVNQNC